MYITLGRFIRSVFEYLVHKSPQWSERERLIKLSFDEMYIDNNCDIDKLLDMPVNPKNHKQAQVVIVKRICAKGEWPYFIDTDYPLTPYDIIESNLNFDACDMTLLAISSDQGASNRGLATKFGISPTQCFIPSDIMTEAKLLRNKTHNIKCPCGNEHPMYWFWDFVHLFKTCRNHMLDNLITLPCGSLVLVQDFYDLLEIVKINSSDHTSGFHISEDHLLGGHSFIT